MKKYKFKILLVALAISILMTGILSAKDQKSTKSTSPDHSNADSIVWLEYNEATKISESEDKHIFIHFTTKTCGWCRKMEKETYTNPDIIKMVNSNFAPVKVWADSQRELDIKGYKITEANLARSEFGVSSYPQFWFVTPKQDKVGPLRGYLPAETFMKALVYVNDYAYDTTRTNQESANK